MRACPARVVPRRQHELRGPGLPPCHGGPPGIVSRNEAGVDRELGWAELRRQVGALAASLRAMGVQRGDRVAAYLPNIPETIVAFLAVASLGAIWSACSPDMGRIAVLDRFRQIAPKVMIAVDGYRYGGKPHDRRELLHELLAELPSVDHLILLPEPRPAGPTPPIRQLHELGRRDRRQCAAAGGACALRSSAMGCVFLRHHGAAQAHRAFAGRYRCRARQARRLHLDLGPEDRFHWYSSSGWIMWNCQISGLLLGSTICIYDGNPGWPDWNALWRFVGETGVTFFGAGAAFFLSCLKAHVEPNQVADLSALRAVGSTGSPLPPEGYQWIYDHVRRDIWLNPSPAAPTSPAASSAACRPAGVSGRDAVPLPRRQGRSLRRRRHAADRRGRRTGMQRADALDAAQVLERPGRPRATARAISTCTPASGATATGCASRRAVAPSSMAARTPPSTATASAWAPASSIARSRNCRRSSTAWWSTSNSSAASPTCRCSS
jgi:acetoacetyl-CoA synthetase